MPLLGTLLKRAIGLQKTIDNVSTTLDKLKLRRKAHSKQKRVLKKLLVKAQFTEFGKHYHFSSILQMRDYLKGFRKVIPMYDYDLIYDKWWHRSLNGEENICWPGKVEYFALSSGTSGASSKYIPVTRDQLRYLQKVSVKQLMTLAYTDIKQSALEKGFLLIGGSTDLKRNKVGYEGDLSGITTSNLPLWFNRFYKPGKDIAREKDWNTKLDLMVKNAKNWDIAFIAGVPAWVKMLIERIIEHYKVKTIHDIWPNLSVYIHGGVSFEPYKNSFELLVKHPLIYLDTYLASEGFIAYQAHPKAKGMTLSLNGGVFFEFVPFNENNFDGDGKLLPNAEVKNLTEVELAQDYALLISTVAGAWRYLIGDTIRFVNLEKNEIIITGRTKHFLSLCGEHLSVDNMSQAIQFACEKLNFDVQEFTVCGVPYQGFFAHHWYLGTNTDIDSEKVKELIDQRLKKLNDDYAVERVSAIKEIIVEIIPLNTFYEFMQKLGKIGSQNKFPRVLKGDKLISWQNFVANKKM